LDDSCGILPRTAQFVFTEIGRKLNQGKKDYRLEVSSLEIYCENVKDLYSDSEEPLNIVTLGGRTHLQGQTWRRVNNSADFIDLVKLSSSKRIFSNNGVNERSSRSHHVFQLKIAGLDP